MPANELFKLALVFGLVGSPQAVQDGEAIMEDWQLFEFMERFGLTPETEEAPLDITWVHFKELLPAIATDPLAQRLHPPEVLMDQSVANQVEFLLWFMGLPPPELAAQEPLWLHTRLVEFAGLRGNALLSLPVPPAAALLPPGNAPWREGLLLHQTLMGVSEEEFSALLPAGAMSRPLTAGPSSRFTPPPSAREKTPPSLPETPMSANLVSATHLSPSPMSAVFDPHKNSQAMSVPDSGSPFSGRPSPGFRTRRSSRAPSSPSSPEAPEPEKEGPPSPPPIPWWVVMFRARGPEPKQEGPELLLQAAAWRHDCPFYVLDLDTASEVFVRRFSLKLGTSVRLYSADGFYREFVGPWTDPAPLLQWLQAKGPVTWLAAGRDGSSRGKGNGGSGSGEGKREGKREEEEEESVRAARFLEVASGVQEYLAAWRSMASKARAEAMPAPAHVKGLAMQLHTRVLRLDHQRLSVHQAFGVAHALRFNRKLRTLSLRGCHLPLPALEALLLSLAFNSVLSTLDISLNPLGGPTITREEDGKWAVTASSVVSALADLFRCSHSLETVVLSGVALDDLAGGALAASLCGNRDIPLVRLDLSDNNLGDKTAQLLAEAISVTRDMLGDEVLHADSKYLGVLDLSGNKMTSRASALLEEASRMHPAPAPDTHQDQVHPLVVLLDHQRTPDPPPPRAPDALPPPEARAAAALAPSPSPPPAPDPRFDFLLHTVSVGSRALWERLHLLRTSTRTISRDPAQPPLRLSASQGHQLLEPFLRSRLLSQAAQWIYCFLTSPEHKEAFSERLDVLLQRAREQEQGPAEPEEDFSSEW